jgi:phosphatidylinositol-3-phosphatase
MRRAFAALTILAAAGGAAIRTAPDSAAAPAVPRFSHVIEVFLENETATSTWEDAAHAPALQELRKQGAYIPNFFGVGHASLDNYEAAFGAVEPTTQGKADCLGQPYGNCIFPASVPTIGALLDEAGLGWKVYSEGEEGAPGGHPCLHAPSRNVPDPYQGPGTNGYATRHNPAPWFDSILSHGGTETYCQAHAVDLTHLTDDLKSPSSLPAFSFVEPDTCHDGHDTQSTGGCTFDPEGPAYPSGVGAINAWLPGFVQQVTTSPAFDKDSLLFITFDEGAATDTAGCTPCHDTSAGGRIGALAISPRIAGGSTSTWAGDHYSFLRTLEASWGLSTLKSRAAGGAAAQTVHDGDPGVTVLADVWAQPAASTVAASPSAPASAARPGGQLAPAGTLATTGPAFPTALGLLVVSCGLVVRASGVGRERRGRRRSPARG